MILYHVFIVAVRSMFDEGGSAYQFKDLPNISKTYQTAVTNIGKSIFTFI